MYGISEDLAKQVARTRLTAIMAAEHQRLIDWPYPFAKATHGTMMSNVRKIALAEGLASKMGGTVPFTTALREIAAPYRDKYKGTMAELLAALPAGSEVVNNEVVFVPAGVATPPSDPGAAIMEQKSADQATAQSAQGESKSSTMLWLGLAGLVGVAGYFALRRRK